MNILISIDSFKGSMTSMQAGEAAKKGILKAVPDADVLVCPLADGGEGTTDALTDGMDGEKISLTVTGPLGEKTDCYYGWLDGSKKAVMEMASAAGITLVHEKNPLAATTFGVGEMIFDAIKRGAENIIIGIGGSATNDAGLGMLQALGFRFFDHDNKLLGSGGQILSRVAAIDTTAVHPALSEASFTIACDVDNPFYGPRGATRIFAGQKGATPEMTEHLEAGMQAIAAVIAQTTGKDIGRIPGSGAAGGVGGAFLAFTNARLMSGIDLILTHLQFGKRIQNADLIITGEGSADAQTTMGKVAYGILREARKQNIPVLLVAGHIADTPSLYTAGFSGIFSIAPGPVTLEKSMHPEFAATHLQRLITQICKLLQAFRV